MKLNLDKKVALQQNTNKFTHFSSKIEDVILPCFLLLCSTVSLGLWVIDNFVIEANRHCTNIMKMNKKN